MGDVVPQFHQLAEHPFVFHDWQAATEAYAEKRAEVHIHFRVGYASGTVIQGDYCAVFDRAISPLDVMRANDAETGGMVGASYGLKQDKMGQSMLVNVRKLVQSPERVGFVFLPSLMRLQALDDCLCTWVDAPDFPFALPRIHNLVPEDWKLRTLSQLGGRRIAVASDNKFIDEVVKGRPKVMQAVAKNEGEIDGRRLNVLNSEDILAHLRIEFMDTPAQSASWLQR